MTIYDLPGIVRQALPHAATPSNIQAGFCAAGIFPFNRDIFGEHEYLPSDVTDRPLDQAITVPQQPSMPATSISAVTEVTSLSVVTVPTSDDAPSTPTTFTPESVRPFPKAGPRTGRRVCIKRKTTEILTDTPVKRALELEQEKGRARQRNRRNQRKMPTNVCRRKWPEHQEMSTKPLQAR